MFRQIKYFQAVVQHNSFSKAAEECHISQSAISQQLQALERDLGFTLLERHHRTFTLTPAGEFFYKKSLVLLADFDRACAEAAKIARADDVVLKIGYLRGYSGEEFHHALLEFSTKYPDVTVQIERGNHEELYQMLRTETADLVLNDQRRAFSEEYVNLILTTNDCFIEIASTNPMANLPSVTPQDMRNTPCILVASQAQQEIEQEFYHDVVGFQGDFLFAGNLEEARLLIVSGKGFMPVEGGGVVQFGNTVTRIPLYRGDAQIKRNYCAFWRKDNSGYYIEEFGAILKKQFEA